MVAAFACVVLLKNWQRSTIAQLADNPDRRVALA
jgi:hypothetical protein